MNRQDTRPNYGYWGMRKSIRKHKLPYTKEELLSNSCIVWIGPMSREKMIETNDEYRHNYSETLPDNLGEVD